MSLILRFSETHAVTDNILKIIAVLDSGFITHYYNCIFTEKSRVLLKTYKRNTGCDKDFFGSIWFCNDLLEALFDPGGDPLHAEGGLALYLQGVCDADCAVLVKVLR